jgi:hypothetical protein
VNPLTVLYVGAVIALGGSALVGLAPREYPAPLLAATWMAAMVVVSLFKLRLPLRRGYSTMSMAYVIDFLVLVTAGADLAMAVAAVGVVVQCAVRVRRRQPWYRTAFSVATVALAVQAAGLIWTAMGGTILSPGLLTTAVPLAAAAVGYFAVNTGLVAVAIVLSNDASDAPAWSSFARTAPAFVVAAGAAIVMQILLRHEAYLFVPGAVTPILVCYFSYAAWFRRIAESDSSGSPALT